MSPSPSPPSHLQRQSGPESLDCESREAGACADLPMLFLLFSHCFPCRAAFLFLRFSYGSPVVFLWFSCDCPIVCLCFSLSLAVVSLCFSCGVLVVFLWLFPTFSIKNRSTNHNFGGARDLILGPFWCPGHSLDPKSVQRCSGGGLGVDF